jgi:hypothetical protein
MSVGGGSSLPTLKLTSGAGCENVIVGVSFVGGVAHAIRATEWRVSEETRSAEVRNSQALSRSFLPFRAKPAPMSRHLPPPYTTGRLNPHQVIACCSLLAHGCCSCRRITESRACSRQYANVTPSPSRSRVFQWQATTGSFPPEPSGGVRVMSRGWANSLRCGLSIPRCCVPLPRTSLRHSW